MRIQISKKECYKTTFRLLVNGEIPDKVLDDYINEVDDSYTALADYVINNMRGEIQEWSTAIGIIEAVDRIYECAVENGNIQTEEN